ncbi:MAG TPA: hypothetical protein VN457_07305, partial [Chlamydiales bacterium]|nr:hypothetical protein [Chlamydiales bacterium]
ALIVEKYYELIDKLIEKAKYYLELVERQEKTKDQQNLHRYFKLELGDSEDTKAIRSPEEEKKKTQDHIDGLTGVLKRYDKKYSDFMESLKSKAKGEQEDDIETVGAEKEIELEDERITNASSLRELEVALRAASHGEDANSVRLRREQIEDVFIKLEGTKNIDGIKEFLEEDLTSIENDDGRKTYIRIFGKLEKRLTSILKNSKHPVDDILSMRRKYGRLWDLSD